MVEAHSQLHVQLQQVGPWHWQTPQGRHVVWQVDTPASAAQHVVRDLWRKGRFEEFLRQDRRDSRGLVGRVQYREQTVKNTASLYDVATQEERGVLLGAAASAACYAAMQVRRHELEGIHQECPFCDIAVVPDGYHLCWRCPRFAEGRPPEPGTLLARRLGWQDAGTKAEAQVHLRYMAGVCKAVRATHGFRQRLGFFV